MFGWVHFAWDHGKMDLARGYMTEWYTATSSSRGLRKLFDLSTRSALAITRLPLAAVLVLALPMILAPVS